MIEIDKDQFLFLSLLQERRRPKINSPLALVLILVQSKRNLYKKRIQKSLFPGQNQDPDQDKNKKANLYGDKMPRNLTTTTTKTLIIRIATLITTEISITTATKKEDTITTTIIRRKHTITSKETTIEIITIEEEEGAEEIMTITIEADIKTEAMEISEDKGTTITTEVRTTTTEILPTAVKIVTNPAKSSKKTINKRNNT